MAGIYIHIPFCRQACTYCNFHFSTSLRQKELLVNSIIKEILITDLANDQAEIHTIYFGGGTPSLLTQNEIERIINSIYSKFTVLSEAEITFEANPENINLSTLYDWKSIGINRLSVGIQSFNEEELLWMNRAHSAKESLKSLELIGKAGFTNYSVDLIYGSQLLNDEILLSNAEIIFKAQVPHISCYALTVEPKTALHNMISNKMCVPINSDKQSEQFILLMNVMKAEGYDHYEISNFCKPGMQSKHNSNYWNRTPYFGFGPSAHSFNGGKVRRWNIANNALYIESLNKNNIPFTEEILTPTQQLNEYIMISLRTSDGLDLKRVNENFGNEVRSAILEQSRRYQQTGHLNMTNSSLVLTNEGKLLADGIAADLFFSE